MIPAILLLQPLQDCYVATITHTQNVGADTLCSRTSFFATFSKYPSHIFLNRSRMSFSTSSSSAPTPSSGNVVSAVLLVPKASMPGSVLADICLEAAGDARPRKG